MEIIDGKTINLWLDSDKFIQFFAQSPFFSKYLKCFESNVFKPSAIDAYPTIEINSWPWHNPFLNGMTYFCKIQCMWKNIKAIKTHIVMSLGKAI